MFPLQLPQLFTKRQYFGLVQTESLQMAIEKFDENGRKFSKQVENVVGNGGIARYKQFLLYPQCFQKPCTTDT